MDLVLTYSNYLVTLDIYSLIGVIFVTFLFIGEPVVLGFAFLSATTTLISPYALVPLAFTTAIIAESFWFLLGRYILPKSVISKKALTQLDQTLTKLSIQSPLRLLFITRLLTGVTIATILYLSKLPFSYRKFLGYTAVVNICWTPLMILVGHNAGKGYTFALTIFNSVTTSALVVFLLFIAIYVSWKHTIRYILKPNE